MKPSLISICYPKTPGSDRMIEQQIEIPPNVGLVSLEMILNAINEQTSLIAYTACATTKKEKL